ncbi:potassium channel family protein [Halobaculum litoreum]|uniref:Potassium channel family protein n=1 Tax=Halobaculum litoreum TaxID=3031998 RepID=A0ABD5XPX8_9EURY|nr:TrkA family potassium uptake protein [Halobaculum sp. DT92]
MSAREDLRVVVVGSGRVGLESARSLAERGHDVVIVERNPERVAAAADEYVATIIEGDAARPSVLAQAAPGRADVVAALTNTLGTNLAVCLAAKRLAPEVRTVLRTTEPDTAEFEPFVDHVVYPERAGARRAVNEIEGGEVVRTIEALAGELEVIEVTVAESAPVAGRTLREVSLPRGSLVISGAEGEHVAGADTALTPGATYLVAAEGDVIDEIRRLFRG